jgi:hypothetical protein
MVIISAQELEKDLHSLPVEKKLAVFDKIYTAYQEARSFIRSDLVWKFNQIMLIISFFFPAFTIITFFFL